MGGCCCASSNRNDSSQLYNNPIILEEQQPLSSRTGATSVIPTALLVDTNLDTSTPQRIPHDSIAGNPQSPLNKRDTPVQTNNSEPVGEIKSSNSGENLVKEINKELVGKEEIDVELELEKSGGLKKSSEPFVAPEECPTCLEEYDEENPKIVTKCEHHFHLSCILEWMERSETCPVCDQEMVLNFPIDD